MLSDYPYVSKRQDQWEHLSISFNTARVMWIRIQEVLFEIDISEFEILEAIGLRKINI